MKRVKIALAVGFVLIVVVAVSREDGLIRRMFSDVTSTEAMAEPQDETSKDPSAEKTELTESTAEDVAAEAEPKAENTKDSAEDDTDPADDGKADVVIESASGDPNQSEETESFEDFTAGIIDSFVDVRYDPNYGGESWDAAEDLPEEVMPEPMESINLNNVEMKNIIQTLGEWTELPIIPTDDAVMSKRDLEDVDGTAMHYDDQLEDDADDLVDDLTDDVQGIALTNDVCAARETARKDRLIATGKAEKRAASVARVARDSAPRPPRSEYRFRA